MKSVAAKVLLFCTFLILLAACDISVDPSGQVYNSGVYKFIYGEVNIPEMQPHESAGVVITRTSDTKPQSAYEVQKTTKATVTSTAASAIAIPPVVTSQRALGNDAVEDAGTNHRYSPSLYLPSLKKAATLREDEQLRQSARAAQPPRNVFNVGDAWQVNLYNYEYEAYETSTGLCVAVSDYAYFLADIAIATTVDPKILAIYVEEFDKNYARMHDTFATEADIDGNGKVMVMIYEFGSENIVGYFAAEDKIETAYKSNFADVFYINNKFVSDKANTNLVSGTLVHEFQHMIFFDNVKLSSDMYANSTWFNEAMSMLAEFVCGYQVDGASDEIIAFRNIYSTLSLTNWTDANYGFSLLFGVYFYETFGKLAVNALYKQSVAGIPAVEIVTGRDFNSTFLDFTTALAISKRGYSSEQKHNFGGIDFRKYDGGKDYNLPPVNSVAAGAGYIAEVPYYGFVASVFSGKVKQIKIGKLFDGVVFIKN